MALRLADFAGRVRCVRGRSGQRLSPRRASRGRDLCPGDNDRTSEEMAADVDAEAEPGWSRVGLHPKLKLSDLLDAQGLHHDDVAVTPVPGRRPSADEASQRASLGSWTAPAGRCSPVTSPAPAGSPVTEAGISATAQCQKPDPLGVSGSYMVTV